jgi:hypothetical protein
MDLPSLAAYECKMQSIVQVDYFPAINQSRTLSSRALQHYYISSIQSTAMSLHAAASPSHLKTKSLSLARSPSHHTTNTVPSSPDAEYHPDHLTGKSKTKRVSEEGSDGYDEARGLVEEMEIMDGPAHEGFDRPDRREMTLILGSTAMVILVAIAAGLTTIYDWIL